MSHSHDGGKTWHDHAPRGRLLSHNHECICPAGCDCQEPDSGYSSNLCPLHNEVPNVDQDCPAFVHRNRATMLA